MKILVTGACGLVGGKIYKHLVNNRHEVIGLGRSICSKFKSSINGSFIELDLSASNAIEVLNKKIPDGVDLVIHCAAQQPRAELLFSDYRKGNIDTTENIFSWSDSSGVEALIAFSTVAFLDFSSNDTSSVDELVSVNPVNYYALSKSVSESFLKISAENSELTVFCFRIPSLVQEEQEGGIAYTYLDFARRNTDLEIYDNGIYMRNMIYIDSILELLDATIEKMSKLSGFNLYHIGSKDAWTMMDIAKYIYREINSKGKVLPVEKSGTVPGHWNISVNKAVNELGFSPWSTKQVLDEYMKNMLGVEC